VDLHGPNTNASLADCVLPKFSLAVAVIAVDGATACSTQGRCQTRPEGIQLGTTMQKKSSTKTSSPMVPSPRNLRKVVNIRQLAMLPGDVEVRDMRLVAIFEQDWPDCYRSDFSGKAIMLPEEEKLMEELFELFGMPLKIAENSYSVISRAFDVFCLFGLGYQLDFFMKFSDEQLEKAYPTWSEDWLTYMKAVGAGDKKAARRLAHKLQVLSPDCEYPYGVFIDKIPLPQ